MNLPIYEKPTPRQASIVKALAERGPMRWSDIGRSQNMSPQTIEQTLLLMVRKGTVVKDSGFYRLQEQTIPPSLLQKPQVIIQNQPTREQVSQIRLEEREAMKKEFEKVRLTLVDVKSFVDSVIKMLTPEEFEEDSKK